jgi:hypothetical protein
MRFTYQVKQSVRKFDSVFKLIVSIKLAKLLTYTSQPPATSPDPRFVQLATKLQQQHRHLKCNIPHEVMILENLMQVNAILVRKSEQTKQR